MTVQESQLASPPVTETLQQQQAAPVSQRPARRTWPFVAVAILAVVVVGLAGMIFWLMASTVTNSDYDAAVADLDAAQSKVTALTEENSNLTADMTALVEEREQLVANIAAAGIAAKALAYLDLNFDLPFVEEMSQAGVDFTSYDELLALLGEDVTLAEWVASNDAFRAAERAVYATEDAKLIDAWNTWLDTEVGTIEDSAAYGEILIRLDQLLTEQLTDTNGAADTNNDVG